MTAPAAADAVIFGREGLDRLVEALIADGYQVIGPTVRDSAIVLDRLDSAAGLPAGWGVDTGPGFYRLRRREDAAVFANSAGPQSWKQFLHPPRRQLWSAGADGEFRPVEPVSPRYAFLGVRGCDLAAIGILGRVLGGGATRTARSPAPPPAPVHRRGELHRAGRGLLLRVDGHRPGPAPGTTWPSPSAPRTAGHIFVIEVGSEEGAQVLAQVPHGPADPAAVTEARQAVADAAGRMGREMPAGDLRDAAARLHAIPTSGKRSPSAA